MSKKKTLSNQERARVLIEQWVTPLLEARIGKANLSEFLWSTSFFYENCDIKQILLEPKEFRRVMVEVIHAWISANRGRINAEWKKYLGSKTKKSEIEKLSMRSFKLINERKLKRG